MGLDDVSVNVGDVQLQQPHVGLSILSGAPDVSQFGDTTGRLQRFLSLATMPEPVLPRHSGHRDVFVKSVNQLCTLYCHGVLCNDQKEDVLFRILCLPKLGLTRSIADTRSRIQICCNGDIDNLFPLLSPADSPLVPFSSPTDPECFLNDLEIKKCLNHVHKGQLRKAAQIIRGGSSIAPLTEEVVTILKEKHPIGPANPFRNLPRGIAPRISLPDSIILKSLIGKLPKDTSAGISGWSTSMIQLCYGGKDNSPLLHFLMTFAREMVAGTAPGKLFLCTSRLTPLLQGEKIRPIACGEMFYRLLTRFILKIFPINTETLLPFQLGVGSPGGVEPVINYLQQEITQALGNPDQPRYFYSLDIANAFNNVSRTAIAEGVSAHARHLFHLTEWAYGTPTPLVCRKGNSYLAIPSSQGVRQGDPLGPLLFSLAIRPRLEQLKQLFSDPRDTIISYLDDINITTGSPDCVPQILELFPGSDGLIINPSKSKCIDVHSINTCMTGFSVLGSILGKRTARSRFLVAKTQPVIYQLHRLAQLPSQVGLLLLRKCIHPQLMHLLRSMDMEDLHSDLEVLDDYIYGYVEHLRGIREAGTNRVRDPIINRIYTLPLSRGGFGLLNYTELRPHARAAALEEATSFLHYRDIRPLQEDPLAPTSQKSRFYAALDAATADFVHALSPDQRITFYDNGSKCGTAWMHAVPEGKFRALTNDQVAAAMNIRVLRADLHNRPVCTLCSHHQPTFHSESCPSRRINVQARHNHVRDCLATFIKANHLQVILEPPVNSNRNPIRADLLVYRLDEPASTGKHYDLTIKQVQGTDTSHRMPDEDEAPGEAQRKACYTFIENALSKGVHDKNHHYTRVNATFPITPLVMSSGGTLHKDFYLFLKETQHLGIMRRSILIDMSLALVRARASTYVLA